jgi:sigma-B regulation protein RsbU (phosphoserine phosphatase)
MNKIFNPAIILLNRLKYPQKFALISLLFALPLALTIGLLLLRIDANVRFTQQESAGTAYLRPLHRLLDHVGMVQRLANRYANGDTTLRDALLENQARIDQDFQALREVDRRFGESLETTEQLSAIEASWRDLKPRTLTMRWSTTRLTVS